jgi:transposase
MTPRQELTDTQWARIVPHLPLQRAKTGRPALDHRLIVEAILWRVRTGAPWRDLPSTFPPWQTVYSRFRRWQEAGVWDRLLAALQTEADANGTLDWQLQMLDTTIVRAHQRAAGAKKGVGTTPSAAAGAD